MSWRSAGSIGGRRSGCGGAQRYGRNAVRQGRLGGLGRARSEARPGSGLGGRSHEIFRRERRIGRPVFAFGLLAAEHVFDPQSLTSVVLDNESGRIGPPEPLDQMDGSRETDDRRHQIDDRKSEQARDDDTGEEEGHPVAAPQPLRGPPVDPA